MTFHSYAQNFEDVILWRALQHIEKGRYLDVGAQDPIVDSVSRAFYEKGWRGIHAEATHFYAEALRADRPNEPVIQAVVDEGDDVATFYQIPDTGLSTGKPEIAERHSKSGWAVREINLPKIKLSSLFDMFGDDQIHWMKIDVEGMEANVLRSWGTHQARPWIVVIESTEPMSARQNHEAWISSIVDRGYDFVYFDGLNRYFISAQHEELVPAFSAPPNVFDQFVVSRNHFTSGKIREELDEAQKRYDEKVEEAAIQDGQHRQALAALESEFEQFAESSEAENHALKAKYEADKSERDKSAKHAKAEFAQAQSDLQQKLIELRRSHQIERGELAENIVELKKVHLEKARKMLEDIASLRTDIFKLQKRAIEKRAKFEKHAWKAKNKLKSAHETISALQADRTQLEISLSDKASEISVCQAEIRARTSDAEKAQHRVHLVTASNVKLLQHVKAQADLISTIRSTALWRWTRWVRNSNFTIGNLEGNIVNMIAESNEVIRLGTPDTGTSEAENFHDPSLDMDIHMNDLSHYKQMKIQPAANVNELLAREDAAFIQCAFLSILERPADDNGFEHYLSWLRRGLAKQAILYQLRHSKEGRSKSIGVMGLDREIKRYRVGKIPVLGRLFIKLWGGERDHAIDRSIRAVDNSVHRVLELVEKNNHAISELAGVIHDSGERKATGGDDPVREEISEDGESPEPMKADTVALSHMSSETERFYRRLTLA